MSAEQAGELLAGVDAGAARSGMTPAKRAPGGEPPSRLDPCAASLRPR
ncbi:hypothetical protein [Sorangium sp. So ce406]